ncbi:MAG: phosphoenolpyruvate--protein phosphotransferase [Myxococcota bacterium]
MASDGERRGVGASPGIAIGPAYVVRREQLIIPEYRVTAEQVESELQRLDQAFRKTREDLAEIRSGMEATGLLGSIFDAQFLFLEDPTLLEQTQRRIREERLNAEWAVQRELNRLEALFESIGDPYIRERRTDVAFVVRRVLHALMGREPKGLGNMPAGVVVVAEDLSPADMAQVKPGQVAGFVTGTGSRTSHVAIMARSLEIPAVVGVGAGLVDQVPDRALLAVDGRTGRVEVDPPPDVVQEFEERRARMIVMARQLLRYADLPAETGDGVRVALYANVDLREEIPDCLRYGAEGIGLFRTEFLFMNRPDLPGEQEQFQTYREILEAVSPHSAVIRTLDLGGDKLPSSVALPLEPNPALGIRGMRLSQRKNGLFRTQLRALLRAGAHGRLRILLPMISGLEELEFARSELEELQADLRREGEAMADSVELGVMVETPAAAMIADLLAERADFLSIGTNDLVQYTLAVDRGNEHVAYLYEPLHPAHLRLIERICQAGRHAGTPVGMCGEMAGEPVHAWVLLALGVTELSMAPSAIPLMKKIIRESTLEEARELYAELLGLGSAAEIRERVERALVGRFPSEFEHIVLKG